MKKIIEAKGKGFIIPNRASKPSGYIFGGEELISIGKINGVANPEDSKFVQIWIVSEDLHSNNIGDHGCKFEEDGKLYMTHYIDTRLPEDLFHNHKEGDIVKVVLLGTCDFAYNKDNRKEYFEVDPFEVEIHLDMELCQNEFRYRSFGTFEQVLERVC